MPSRRFFVTEEEPMDVFDRERLKIARKTLRLSDAGAMILGGMSKSEARRVISDNCMRQAEYRRQLMQLEGTIEFAEDISPA